jgi:signal transduction histidine kinase
LQVIRSESGNINTRLQQLGIVDDDINEAQSAIETHLTRIDENISFLAKISTGDLEQEEDVNLADIVARQCNLFRTRCSAAGITLDVKVPAVQQATVNQPTIAIVLGNLLVNAIEAMHDIDEHKVRTITVSLTETNQNHVIRVIDTGTGIPPDVRDKLLKEFATGKTGGLGIGLYNCKLILEAQGGEIDFVTESGVGTQFIVRLPK